MSGSQSQKLEIDENNATDFAYPGDPCAHSALPCGSGTPFSWVQRE